MALTRTNKIAANSGTSFGTGAYTTASFTPAAGATLVVAVMAFSNAADALAGADITITDSLGPLTWTERAVTTTHPNWGYGIRVFSAVAPSATAMTITVDAGAFNVHDWRVEVEQIEAGVGNTVGFGGKAVGNTTGVDAFNMTLDATPAASSIIFAWMNEGMGSGTGDATAGTGWTELYDAATTSVSGWVTFHGQMITGVTSTSVDWVDILTAGGSMPGAVFAAIEVKEVAGGGGSGPALLGQAVL